MSDKNSMDLEKHQLNATYPCSGPHCDNTVTYDDCVPCETCDNLFCRSCATEELHKFDGERICILCIGEFVKPDLMRDLRALIKVLTSANENIATIIQLLCTLETPVPSTTKAEVICLLGQVHGTIKVALGQIKKDKK